MKHIFTLAALVFATAYFGQEACQSDLDINANGAIDIADFLHVLGLFGDVDSDEDGVWDSQDLCTDLDACNFNDELANFCIYPDAVGDCNGDCPVDEDGDGVCDVFSCGNPFQYQNHSYQTVYINQRCWFAENLRTQLYQNNDEIPFDLSGDEWYTASFGGVAVYGEGSHYCESWGIEEDACDEVWSLSQYGRIYNWHAVGDERGLCPTGWHVATDEEWTSMEVFLHGSEFESWEHNRGTHAPQLMSSEGWPSFIGTNESGFSALPGGWKNTTGAFQGAGYEATWWTGSAATGSKAWARCVFSDHEYVQRDDGNKKVGRYVRCIQDSE